jgi:hypothetical protein
MNLRKISSYGPFIGHVIKVNSTQSVPSVVLSNTAYACVWWRYVYILLERFTASVSNLWQSKQSSAFASVLQSSVLGYFLRYVNFYKCNLYQSPAVFSIQQSSVFSSLHCSVFNRVRWQNKRSWSCCAAQTNLFSSHSLNAGIRMIIEIVAIGISNALPIATSSMIG